MKPFSLVLRDSCPWPCRVRHSSRRCPSRSSWCRPRRTSPQEYYSRLQLQPGHRSAPRYPSLAAPPGPALPCDGHHAVVHASGMASVSRSASTSSGVMLPVAGMSPSDLVSPASANTVRSREGVACLRSRDRDRTGRHAHTEAAAAIRVIRIRLASARSPYRHAFQPVSIRLHHRTSDRRVRGAGEVDSLHRIGVERYILRGWLEAVAGLRRGHRAGATGLHNCRVLTAGIRRDVGSSGDGPSVEQVTSTSYGDLDARNPNGIPVFIGLGIRDRTGDHRGRRPPGDCNLVGGRVRVVLGDNLDLDVCRSDVERDLVPRSNQSSSASSG